MKKLIIALIALSMLLSCLATQAEGASTVFKDIGIAIDFEDVLNGSPNYMELGSLGVVNFEPFVACMNLEYYTASRDIMDGLIDDYDSYSEELKRAIHDIYAKDRIGMAYVIVTDARSVEDAIELAFDQCPEGTEVAELGGVGSYRWYSILPPVEELPEDYEAFAAFGLDPEDVRQEDESLQADIDRVRTAFIERLQSAELFEPVYPGASVVGQVLSFETTDVDGNAVTSDALFGDNAITLVNVWGTWCVNCAGEIGELAQIHARLREKGCGVVGIEDEKKPAETMREEIHAFMEARGMNYPSVLMPKDNAILSMVTGYPTTFFVDSTGKVLTCPIFGAAVDAYERTVEQLLSGEEATSADRAGSAILGGNEYRVIVTDPDGDPVEGAVIQLCDDSICSFQPTGADGVATFAVEKQGTYEVHVLMAPEGYAPDESVYSTPEILREVRIVLEKAA